MNRLNINFKSIFYSTVVITFAFSFVSCKSTKQAYMEETEQIGLLRQLLSLPFDIFSIKDAEFVQGRPTEYLTGFMWSIKETDLNPGFSSDPIDQIMVAEAVLGAPGLVYSPHQEGMLVDVKRFQAGEEVICPHSGLKFLVPDNVQPTLNIGDAMSPVAAVNAENTEQKILPIEEETQKNTEKPVIEGQTAKRVIGKENLVYSPYTNGSYVVDITGLMPGERARCPYTGRIFTIPSIGDISKGEEFKKKNIVDEAIASISDSIEYKVIESKDDTEIKAEQDKDKSIVPFARWSKRVGYVISPYGGQLIDVQGKSPGSVLRCPFSGNLFKLPKAED